MTLFVCPRRAVNPITATNFAISASSVRTPPHLDTWRANLIARDKDGVTETAAIDRSLLGLAPAGQEIAVFVTGVRLWLSLGSSEANVIGDLALRSYPAGLRDAGWTGTEADVRFAYAASAALWTVIATLLWLRWFTLTERRAGWSASSG